MQQAESPEQAKPSKEVELEPTVQPEPPEPLEQPKQVEVQRYGVFGVVRAWFSESSKQAQSLGQPGASPVQPE